MTTELFTNIPDEVKKRDEAFIDLAFMQPNLYDAAKMVYKYVQTCLNEEEQEFIDFYFNLKLEEMQKGK